MVSQERQVRQRSRWLWVFLVAVLPSNTCGNSSTNSSVAVSVTNGAADAGTITGTSTVCENETGVTYSIASVSGASGYAWTLPTGATVASGANAESITVDFASTGGNVSVIPTSSCGNGLSSSFPVVVNLIPVTFPLYYE